MGLDMYLTAKRYVSDYNPEDADLRAGIMALDFGMSDMEVKEVSFEAMYWRKANGIHRWFVQNVQEGVDDCGEYYVTTEDLETLLGLCKQVLEDNSKAHELLPPQSGFFFGGTDVDDWYLEQLAATAARLETLLNMDAVKNHDVNLYYQSSW